MHPGRHRRDAGGQKGAARLHRRRARKRAGLAGAAARFAEPRSGGRARTRRRRRRARLLEGARRTVADHPRAALLGAQERQCPQQTAEEPAAEGQAIIAGNLDGRDQQGCSGRIRCLHRRLPAEIRQGRRVPGKGPPCPARLLRFPRRTLETPADLEPDREHFRHRAAPHNPLEGLPVEQDGPRDGVQAGRRSAEKLAPARWPQSVAQAHSRCQVYRRDRSRRQPGALEIPNRRRLNPQAITKIRRYLLANHAASLPVAWRLYLPLEWTADTERCAAAGIPETIGFLSKPEIALEQIRAACAAGLPRGVVLMDAGYGTNTRLREEIGALGLSYVAGIPPQTSVWPPGTAPLPPLPWSGRGRRPKLMRRDAEHRPVSVKALALDLPAVSWQTVSGREGSAGALTSRFARVRVRAAHRDEWRSEPRGEEWLLIEWPKGDTEPAKYWLATLPPDMPFDRLVDLAKLRWRIERDYQELKQELGLGHYEGRGWRGFHHHATLCIAAYAFLIAERARVPPSAAGNAAGQFAALGVPQNRPPRGAARPSRTTCRNLDRDNPPTPDRRPRNHLGAMSVL